MQWALEWYLVYHKAAIFEPMVKQNVSFRVSIYNKLKHSSIVIERLVSFKRHVEHVTATVIDHLSNYVHDM
jgi:hypothetical protein